jgi:hypothetical protein
LILSGIADPLTDPPVQPVASSILSAAFPSPIHTSSKNYTKRSATDSPLRELPRDTPLLLVAAVAA